MDWLRLCAALGIGIVALTMLAALFGLVEILPALVPAAVTVFVVGLVAAMLAVGPGRENSLSTPYW
ncbi:hypothetical protein ACNS7O_01000 [Haloferacaceae archaeon DSL9]